MANLVTISDFNRYPIYLALDAAGTERLKEAISFYETKYLKIIFDTDDLAAYNLGVGFAYTELKAIFKEAFKYAIFFHFSQSIRKYQSNTGSQQGKLTESEYTTDVLGLTEAYNQFVNFMDEATEYMNDNSIASNNYQFEIINAFNI